MKKEAVGPIGLVSSLVFSFTLDWILGVLCQGFICLVAMYFVGDLEMFLKCLIMGIVLDCKWKTTINQIQVLLQLLIIDYFPHELI